MTKQPLLGNLALLALLAGPASAQSRGRLNPMIDLLEKKQPVFGLYAPRNPRNAATQKTPVQLAREALAYPKADFIFDGSMEGNFERGYPAFAEFAQAMFEAGLLDATTSRLTHPLVVKMHRIMPDVGAATANIRRQLELGVSTIAFVHVESAEEVRAGLSAMRMKANRGTRAADVGNAPARWGMSDAEYRQRADVWPLNPHGELMSWVIVESHEGLANVREIAAVDGVGVLFPGAGTLRGVFTTTSADGKRVFDADGWEAAIQKVLAACKEFAVPCGYPASENDIERRMQQGFSVFIMGWGEPGFRAIDLGRSAAASRTH